MSDTTVLLDLSEIRPMAAGALQYARLVLDALTVERPRWRVTAILNPMQVDLAFLPPTVSVFPERCTAIGAAREYFFARNRARISGFSVFHSLFDKWPWVQHGGIVTVHDLRHVHHNTMSGPAIVKRMYVDFTFKRLARLATSVICISDTTRKMLEARYRVNGEITVIHHSLSPSTGDPAPVLPDRLQDESPFVLLPAAVRRHKNIAAAVRAIEIVNSNRKHSRVKLVVSGGIFDRAYYEEIRSLSPDVLFLRHADHSIMETLYRRAVGVVLLSDIEGFGFPILETLRARKGIILSDIPVFREVFPENPYFVPAKDSGAIAAALGTLLSGPAVDGALYARVEARYSAERFRAKLIGVYEATVRHLVESGS